MVRTEGELGKNNRWEQAADPDEDYCYGEQSKSLKNGINEWRKTGKITADRREMSQPSPPRACRHRVSRGG